MAFGVDEQGMYFSMKIRQGSAWPFILILLGASVWGFIWYPMRKLVDMHVTAIDATLLTGLAGATLMALLLRGTLRNIPFHPLILGLLGASGITALGFYWGVTHGAVMRVLLLFYLSPVWTAVFAHLLLREPLTRRTAGLSMLSLAGAGLILWTPAIGLPLPTTIAEWAGLAAGIGFAMHNVLVVRISRELPAVVPMARTFLLFSGEALLSLVVMGLQAGWHATFHTGVSNNWQTLAWIHFDSAKVGVILGLSVVIGMTLALNNLMVQHGLPHIPANRASLIMLFEIVVTALSSWLLANEVPGVREWLGGGCIVLATLLASRVRNE